MPDPLDEEGPLPLLGITLARSLRSGRAGLAYGSGMSVLLVLALQGSGAAAFIAAFPLFLPIFASVGSLGSLMVFTNDRLKGVLEYLLAYGMSPRRIFADFLIACTVLVSVVFSVAVTAATVVFAIEHGTVPLQLVEVLAIYALPMGYASAAFGTILGMYWTALSTPRGGMNSPLGIVPFLGILPPLGTLAGVIYLGVHGELTDTLFLLLGGVLVVAVLAVITVLLASVDRLLRRERMLSPS